MPAETAKASTPQAAEDSDDDLCLDDYDSDVAAGAKASDSDSSDDEDDEDEPHVKKVVLPWQDRSVDACRSHLHHSLTRPIPPPHHT